MAYNFLEQLIAEWYEYQGYFIRKNVLVGKRSQGGYECELDIVAFHPEKKHLVHIEPSMDASSWAEREKRYEKKFKAGKKYIPGLFEGLKIPKSIEQIALLGFASKKTHKSLAGGKILLVDELLKDIFEELRHTSIYTGMVPEGLPILRALQFVVEYRDDIYPMLFDQKI